jgi:hypothetical protein
VNKNRWLDGGGGDDGQLPDFCTVMINNANPAALAAIAMSRPSLPI